MAEQELKTVRRRFTFEFSAYVTREVEVPEGANEHDDAFEAALQRVANAIDVNDCCTWEDAYPAEDEPAEEEKPSA